MSPALDTYSNCSPTYSNCSLMHIEHFLFLFLTFDFPLPPFLISVLFHKQQHSHEALIIAPRVSISRREKSCLIALNVLQLYSISCTGQSISLTVGWMIIGRVLRTLKGFLGQNNRSYWPHSGDNTLSSCFFSVCLSLSHANRGFLRVAMSEV